MHEGEGDDPGARALDMQFDRTRYAIPATAESVPMFRSCLWADPWKADEGRTHGFGTVYCTVRGDGSSAAAFGDGSSGRFLNRPCNEKAPALMRAGAILMIKPFPGPGCGWSGRRLRRVRSTGWRRDRCSRFPQPTRHDAQRSTGRGCRPAPPEPCG